MQIGSYATEEEAKRHTMDTPGAWTMVTHQYTYWDDHVWRHVGPVCGHWSLPDFMGNHLPDFMGNGHSDTEAPDTEAAMLTEETDDDSKGKNGNSQGTAQAKGLAKRKAEAGDIPYMRILVPPLPEAKARPPLPEPKAMPRCSDNQN